MGLVNIVAVRRFANGESAPRSGDARAGASSLPTDCAPTHPDRNRRFHQYRGLGGGSRLRHLDASPQNRLPMPSEVRV